MTTRVKSKRRPVQVPTTREEAVELVRQITGLKAMERGLKADLDLQITAIKEQFEGALAKIEESLEPLVQDIEAWAEAHRAEFGERRSLDMLHGVIGWRLSPPAVEPLKGMKWSAVLERLVDLNRGDLIRVKHEPDKPALLAASKVEDLRRLYCQVTQRDEFFVDPELTESESREVAS